MDNFNIHKFFKNQYLNEGVNDNITKSNISNLDYDAIKYIFPEISTRNRISFPNPDDSLNAVGNERDWEDWKNKIMKRYGDVELEMDPNNSMWFRRVKINDDKFKKDKDQFIKGKQSFIDREQSLGRSIDENHDCEKEHPGMSHEEYVKKEKDIDTIKMMAPKTDTNALRQIVKNLVAKKKKGIPPNARFTDVEEGTCGYDRDAKTGKKLDGPGGLGEDYKGKSEYTEDEVKYSIGVDDDYEGWVDVAFQKGFKYNEDQDQWYGPGSLGETKLKENTRTRELADSYTLDELKSRLAQIWREMEEEAEPEGGPVADQYADEIQRYEDAIRLKKGDSGREMTYGDMLHKNYPDKYGPGGTALNEATDDEIAQSEFGMDYEQLGPGEKEWVDDVQYEMADTLLNEDKRRQIQFKYVGSNARIKALLKNLKKGRDYDFGVGQGGLVLLDIDVRYLDQLVSILNKSRIPYKMVEGKLNESEKSWNAVDVSRTAEKELSNKEWNERTAKKLEMLMKLNAAGKFKKDFDEERLQGWVDQNYSWEKLSRQFKVNEDKGKLTKDEDLVSTFGKDWVEKFKPLKEKLNNIEKSLPETMKSSDRINREVS